MATIASTEVVRADGGWLRRRSFVERGIPSDAIKLAGSDDQTDVYLGPYDAGCASCWFGHGHSVAKHAQSAAGVSTTRSAANGHEYSTHNLCGGSVRFDGPGRLWFCMRCGAEGQVAQ